MYISIRSSSPRGSALLEAMIALSILLVGMVGLMRLQVFGIMANRGARDTMRAGFLARDLAAQLKVMPLTQAGAATPQLLADVTSAEAVCPAPFGNLLGNLDSVMDEHDGTVPENLPPGAYPDALIERDDDGGPLYQRRWTICDYAQDGSGATPAKLIASSVIYRERIANQLREVVVYSQVSNPADLSSSLSKNLAAFR